LVYSIHSCIHAKTKEKKKEFKRLMRSDYDEKRNDSDNDKMNKPLRKLKKSPMSPPLLDKQLSQDSNMSPIIFKKGSMATRTICARTEVKRSHLCRNFLASRPCGQSMKLLFARFDENKRLPSSTTLASCGLRNR